MKTENKAFYKKLFALVIPIAVQNLMTALVSASDALMLGFLDQSSLSAVSLATQVQFVLNLFFCAILIGETILAAQCWGKEDKASVEKVLAIVLKLSTVIALVFSAAALLVPGALMRIFTNEGFDRTGYSIPADCELVIFIYGDFPDVFVYHEKRWKDSKKHSIWLCCSDS